MTCIFYFRKLLKAGRARHWTEILEEMTGSRKMSAKPLLDYFEPLRRYLQHYIRAHNVPVGWKRSPEQKPAGKLIPAPSNVHVFNERNLTRKQGFRIARRRNHRAPSQGQAANSQLKGSEVDFQSSRGQELKETFSLQVSVLIVSIIWIHSALL